MREMHVTRDELGPPKRKSNAPEADAVTRQELDAVIGAVAELFEEQRLRRRAQVAELRKHIVELETRIRPAEVEQRLGKLEAAIEERKWCGVWNGGAYRAGNEVTHDGGKWHANIDTESKPGADNIAWTLCEKSDRPQQRTARSGRS